MFVIKRNGSEEPVHFDKITSRIKKLAYGLNADFCDPVRASDPHLHHVHLSRQAPHAWGWGRVNGVSTHTRACDARVLAAIRATTHLPDPWVT